MSDPYLALQVIMMPRDANPHPTVAAGGGPYPAYSTIFGGVLLSYIDQAGAVAAGHEVLARGGVFPFVVTVAMNRVEFRRPVLVGDVVRFLTRVVRFGRTSITIQVTVEAQRGAQLLHVTEAEVVYVNIDANSPERRPRPLLGDKDS
jgi:acyl-CoA thioesterase YciA